MGALGAGCFHPSSDDSEAQPGGEVSRLEDSIRSPEEALKHLSSEDAARFEKWKVSLLKNCDAESVFPEWSNSSVSSDSGSVENQSKALDVHLLFQELGHSMLLTGQGAHEGERVVLGQPVAMSGGATSRVDRAFHSQGKNRYRLEAEFRLVDGKCTVLLFGYPVYEALLIDSIPVQAYFNPGRTDLTSLESNLVSKSSRIERHSLEWAALDSLKPEDGAYGILMDRFGLGREQARRRFPLSSDPISDHAISLLGKKGIATFGRQTSDLIGSKAALEALAAELSSSGKTSRLEVLLRFAAPRVRIGDRSNTADEGVLWMIRVGIQIDKAASKAKLSLSSQNWLDPQPRSDSQGVACFLERFEALKNESPAYLEAVGPCGVLAQELEPALLSDERSRSTLSDFFSRLTGSRKTDFSGWEEFLVRAALSLGENGKGLASVLDPHRQAPVIQSADRYLSLVIARLAKGEWPHEIRRALVRMSILWALQGEQVADARLEQILKAVENTLGDFRLSALSWISELAERPDLDPAVLENAIQIGDDFKKSARHIRERAERLGQQTWSDARLSRLIQDRISSADLARWSQMLDAAEEFVRQEESRSAGESVAPAVLIRRKEFLKRSLGEGWLSEDYDVARKITDLVRLQKACRSFRDQSSLAFCAGIENFSRGEGKFLDPAFKGRYGKLAVSYAEILAELEASGDDLIRGAVEREFYAPIWKSCSAAEFDLRASQLKSWVQSRKNDQGIRDVLRDCKKN